MAAGRYRYGPRVRELLLRLRAFGARHELLSAAVFFTVLACAWSWPMFKGDQLTQDYVLYRSVPWHGARPEGSPVTPRSTDGDVATQLYPLFRVARGQVRDGRLPLWDPYIYGGMTLVGDMQSAVLWPLTWLGWLLPAGFAWGLISTLKLAVAGFGAFLLARELGVRRGGCLVAGAVYGLSAPLVMWLQWPLGSVEAMLPWLVLAAHRLYVQPSPRRFAAAAAVFAVSVAGGHPESAAVNAAFATLYVLALAAMRHGAVVRQRARLLGLWLGGLVAGALAAAAVALPFFEALRDSVSATSHVQAGQHVPAWASILYALPNVYGLDRLSGVPGLTTYSSFAVYFGVAAMLLALVGGWRARRLAPARALAIVAGLALMARFGAPPMNWLFHSVWPFKLVVIGRMYAIVALAGAVGAGAAVSSLARRPMPVRAALIWTAGLGALVSFVALLDRSSGNLNPARHHLIAAAGRFALFLVLGALCLLVLGRLRRTAAVALVLVVCVADLALFQPYNVWLPSSSAHLPTTGAVRFLAEHRASRTSSVSPGVINDVLPPNTGAPTRLETVMGYDLPQADRWATFATRVLGQRGFAEHVNTTPVPAGAGLRGLRLFNTRYYVTAPGAPPPDPAFRPVYRGTDATVWQDPAALPRAFVVPSARPLGTGAALAVLAAGRLDPSRLALIPAQENAVTGTHSTFRAASTHELAPDRLRVDVPAGGRGWLVVGNAYFPSWRAKVDGREVPVRRTDYAAIGLPLAAGSHTVELSVRHASFWIGAAVSAFTLAALAATALLSDRLAPGDRRW